MNQPRTNNTNSDKEMYVMAEEELARLRRQLRIMEEDRLAFLEETGIKLKRQRKIMLTLKNEKEKIDEEINVATCKKQKQNDEQLIQRMSKLLQDYKKYEELVKAEKEQLKELDVQIKKIISDFSVAVKELETQNDAPPLPHPFDLNYDLELES